MNIDDLKKTSKLWCRDGIKYFSDDKIYYITPNMILDNLYYDIMGISVKGGSYYKPSTNLSIVTMRRDIYLRW